MLFKLVPALLLLSLSASAQTKIGTVNLTKVFDDYYKTKQANAVIKERVADLDKEFRVMVAEYDKLNEDYKKLLADANNQALASDERDKRKKLAEDKFTEFTKKKEEIADYRQRMGSTEGKRIYLERAATAETVNADLKTWRGLDRLLVRGTGKVLIVATWSALAYNLLRAIKMDWL